MPLQSAPTPYATTMTTTAAATTASNASDRPQKKAILSLKSWWQHLTRHNSSNPDSHSVGPDTPLHHAPYQPRHAGRDALLAVPVAERKSGPTTKVPAVKRLSGGEFAVHPNRELSFEGLASFPGPWGRRKGMGRNSWSPWSSDRSQSKSEAGMESIREDCLEGREGDEGSPQQQQQQQQQAARQARAEGHKHSSACDPDGTVYGDAGSAGEGEGSSSGWSTVTSSTASPDKNSSNLSSRDPHMQIRRQQQQRQREVDALLARQLQEHVSPSNFGRRSAAGFGKRTLHAGPPAGSRGRVERRGDRNTGASGSTAAAAAAVHDVAGVQRSGDAGREIVVTSFQDGMALAENYNPDQTGRKMTDSFQHGQQSPPTREDDIVGGACDQATRPASSRAHTADTEATPHTPLEPARNESVGTIVSPTDTVFSCDIERNASSASEATTSGIGANSEAFGNQGRRAVGDTSSGQEPAEDKRAGPRAVEKDEAKGCEENDWGREVLEAARAL